MKIKTGKIIDGKIIMTGSFMILPLMILAVSNVPDLTHHAN